MFWTVKANGEDIHLDPQNLYTMLLKKATEDVNKPDKIEMGKTIVMNLLQTRVLATTPFLDLAILFFSLGYRYRVFLERNEVELNDEHNLNETSEQPGSPGRG